MNNFTLDQAWVTRVTRPDADDIPVVGADLGTPPDKGELEEVLRKVAASETAKEMVRRKWFAPSAVTDKVLARGTALLEYLAPRAHGLAPAMFKGRRESNRRGFADEVATMAWVAHVTDTAIANKTKAAFDASKLTDAFMNNVVKCSSRADGDGPRHALNLIQGVGIHVVVEHGLPGMSIDGAAFHTKDLGPVLALTVRYDRLDNFWFTLMHELGHIALHLSKPADAVFLDSVEAESGDEMEAEANAFAKDRLIPRDTWSRSPVARLGDKASVIQLAANLKIHPAIVAGRIRYERRNYKLFDELIGRDEVSRSLFAG